MSTALAKKDYSVKFVVSASMWKRIRRILIAEEYTLSEYFRHLLREDLKHREGELDSSFLEDTDRSDLDPI